MCAHSARIKTALKGRHSELVEESTHPMAAQQKRWCEDLSTPLRRILRLACHRQAFIYIRFAMLRVAQDDAVMVDCENT